MDTGQPDALAFYGGQLAVARLQQGRLAELAPLLDQVILDNPDSQVFPAVRTITFLETGDRDQAAERLKIAARDNFAAVPHDANWFDTLFAYSYVTIELQAVPVAEKLLDLLAPFGDQVVNEHPTCNNGPIANPLGNLATVLGRYDEAESYLSQGTEITVRGHLKYAEARRASSDGLGCWRPGDDRATSKGPGSISPGPRAWRRSVATACWPKRSRKSWPGWPRPDGRQLPPAPLLLRPPKRGWGTDGPDGERHSPIH